MARTRYRPALSDERAEALWVEHAGAQPEGWQVAMSPSCALRLLGGRVKEQVDLEGHPGDPCWLTETLVDYPKRNIYAVPLSEENLRPQYAWLAKSGRNFRWLHDRILGSSGDGSFKVRLSHLALVVSARDDDLREIAKTTRFHSTTSSSAAPPPPSVAFPPSASTSFSSLPSFQQGRKQQEASHLCNNPRCFSPSHLIVESRGANSSRSDCFAGLPCRHSTPCKVARRRTGGGEGKEGFSSLADLLSVEEGGRRGGKAADKEGDRDEGAEREEGRRGTVKGGNAAATSASALPTLSFPSSFPSFAYSPSRKRSRLSPSPNDSDDDDADATLPSSPTSLRKRRRRSHSSSSLLPRSAGIPPHLSGAATSSFSQHEHPPRALSPSPSACSSSTIIPDSEDESFSLPSSASSRLPHSPSPPLPSSPDRPHSPAPPVDLSPPLPKEPSSPSLDIVPDSQEESEYLARVTLGDNFGASGDTGEGEMAVGGEGEQPAEAGGEEDVDVEMRFFRQERSDGDATAGDCGETLAVGEEAWTTTVKEEMEEVAFSPSSCPLAAFPTSDDFLPSPFTSPPRRATYVPTPPPSPPPFTLSPSIPTSLSSSSLPSSNSPGLAPLPTPPLSLDKPTSELPPPLAPPSDAEEQLPLFPSLFRQSRSATPPSSSSAPLLPSPLSTTSLPATPTPSTSTAVLPPTPPPTPPPTLSAAAPPPVPVAGESSLLTVQEALQENKAVIEAVVTLEAQMAVLVAEMAKEREERRRERERGWGWWASLRRLFTLGG